MVVEQKQSSCNRCLRLTLHTRSVRAVPHRLHLILSVLSCGVWLVVWLIHIGLNSSQSDVPFRCTKCGQVMGELTEEQQAAENKGKEALMEIASAQKQIWYSERRKRIDARRKRRAERRQEYLTILSATWRATRELPRNIDKLFQHIAGKDEVILCRFLEGLTIAILIAVLLLATVKWLS